MTASKDAERQLSPETRPTHGPLKITMGEEPPASSGWEDVEPSGLHRDRTAVKMWQRRQPLRALDHVAGNSNIFDQAIERAVVVGAGNPGHVMCSSSRAPAASYYQVSSERLNGVAVAVRFSWTDPSFEKVADRNTKHMNVQNSIIPGPPPRAIVALLAVAPTQHSQLGLTPDSIDVSAYIVETLPPDAKGPSFGSRAAMFQSCWGTPGLETNAGYRKELSLCTLTRRGQVYSHGSEDNETLPTPV